MDTVPSNAVKVYGIDRSYAVTTVGHIGARSHRHEDCKDGHTQGIDARTGRMRDSSAAA